MTNQNIKKLVTAALLAAMTCVATMIIKIPTPTFGYIHPGDGFVLLCGVVLGPLPGALAAGIGSMFSDIFSGYVTWAPAIFIIKALTGAALPDCSSIVLKNTLHSKKRDATQRSQSAASSEKPSWSSAIFSTKPDLPHSAAEP